MAKRAGIVVEEFGIGYPPRVSKLGQDQSTIYTFNGLLIGSFIKMLGEKDATIPNGFAGKSKLTRLSVLIVGPILNLVTMTIFLIPAIGFFTLAYTSGISEPITGINANGDKASIATTVINEVMPNSPAAETELKSGDIIIGADETEFKYVGDLIAYIEKVKGEEIILHIQRESQRIDIPIVPRTDPLPNQGGLGIGINYEDIKYTITYYPLREAFTAGVRRTAEYGWLIVEPRPIRQDQNELILPPDKVVITRWFPTLWFLGVLSASVTVPIVLATMISLLPIPKWDNWRILALVFEK